METHYKGHTIRVSAVRITQTARWTVRAWITWDFPNDSGAHMIVHSDLEFDNPEEAMQAGVEFARKWIDEGKADWTR